MLEGRRRGSAVQRSSSTPPWFAKNCHPPGVNGTGPIRLAGGAGDISSPQVPVAAKTPGRPAGVGSTNRAGEGFPSSSSASPSPQPARETSTTTARTPTVATGATSADSRADSSRTPVLRNTEPRFDMEDVLPGEDFVEGGVELSPPGSPEFPGHDGGASPEQLTRPLAQLEEKDLAEFWPDALPKALFLDYDGTMREFEDRPEMATPTPEIQQLLQLMEEREDIFPHIISGRPASFLDEHFGYLSTFTLVAEHGFQIRRSGSSSWAYVDGTTNHDLWKAAIRADMDRFVQCLPGSHLEEKASCLVWHYREVKDQVRAEAEALDAVESLSALVSACDLGDVRVSKGHKIVEASYRKVQKGPVMRKLCEERSLFGEPYAGVLTAGDDVSDESMFDAAAGDYLTIKVGHAATKARFRVDSPQELRRFLASLLHRGPPSEPLEE